MPAALSEMSKEMSMSMNAKEPEAVSRFTKVVTTLENLVKSERTFLNFQRGAFGTSVLI